MCGFIGAGKTTFAKKLEHVTGAVRITKDEWSISLIGNDPTIAGYAEWDARIVELSRNVAFQLVEKGIDVIIDEGVWEKDQRIELGPGRSLSCADDHRQQHGIEHDSCAQSDEVQQLAHGVAADGR